MLKIMLGENQPIQIQHLLKLNSKKGGMWKEILYIQIQHLLKLNYGNELGCRRWINIQIQHLLKLNLKLLCKKMEFIYSNTTLVKVKFTWLNIN